MMPHTDLHFLQEKIKNLKNALFFSQNTSLLRIATSIVSVLKVDDLGQLWFFVPRPQQVLQEFDREFPVKLEFFKKGADFFLHVSGKAYIVNDPEEMNSLMHDDIRELAGNHLVLIKVKMLKADYFENPKPAAHFSWWRDLRNQLHTWMYNTRPGYRPYYLAESATYAAGTPMPMLSYRTA